MDNIKNNKKEKTPILLYVAEDGKTEIEVSLEGETVWLSQKQMGRNCFKKQCRLSMNTSRMCFWREN